MTAVSVALILGCLLIPRFSRRSAAERHLAWAACLGAAAALPLLTMFFSWQPEWARHAIEALAPSLVPQPWTGHTDADVIVRAIGVENEARTVGSYVLMIWNAGAVLMVALVIVQALKLAWLSAAAERVTDGPLFRIASDTAQSLGLTRKIRLLRSPRGNVPMTWGVLRPRVLLPNDATGWSAERLRVVLAHELAHVKRRDWLVQMTAELACAVYWIHPLFWIARHQIRRESEHAADDVVLSLGVDGSDYATHLLEIVRTTRAQVSWSPTVAMARPSRLEQRFAALLNAGTNRRSVSWRTALAIFSCTMLVTVPLTALRGPLVDMAIEVRTDNLPDIGAGGAGQTGGAERAGGTGGAGNFAREIRVAQTEAMAPEVLEYTTPPLYSDEARVRRIEGIVTVQARIDADGSARDARVVRPLGSGLDQNALIAVRQWRFRPGARNGRPEAMVADIDVEFTLRQEALNELIANEMATNVGPGITPPHAVRVFGVKTRRYPIGAAVPPLGTVVLDVVLLEDGRPKIVRILKSVHPDFDETAVRTFEQWRFSPAMKDGRPIKVRMNAEMRFR